MKVSTRGRYGLKAIIDIAIESDNGSCVTLKSVAERQGIPENYLEQIVAILKKAGFLKSIRGAQGGYVLNRDKSQITVGEVLRALEGSLSPVPCVEDNSSGTCNVSDCNTCLTKSLWGKIYDSLNEVIDSITLEDMINDHEKVQMINI